ncbi:MAG: RNA polymerase sigma-70 factor, partial [Balneolaceae bacterium]
IFWVLLSKLDSTDSFALYEAIKNGDQDAFKKFYDTYFEKLYLYLKSRDIRSDAAEDLIQKAFIYIWENRQKINPDLSLKAYLYRIAYTRMINHVNKNKSAEKLSTQHTESPDTPLEQLQYRELHQSMKEAVQQMPERRRAVFEHCFLNEFTYKETAKILDISPKTVENHMALALKEIRASLKKYIEN